MSINFAPRKRSRGTALLAGAGEAQSGYAVCAAVRRRHGARTVRHWLRPRVLLDATIVRMLLAPATMELLGDRNWWIPRWLDRIIPKLNVDGPAHDRTPADAVDEPAPAPEPVGPAPQPGGPIPPLPALPAG